MGNEFSTSSAVFCGFVLINNWDRMVGDCVVDKQLEVEYDPGKGGDEKRQRGPIRRSDCGVVGVVFLEISRLWEMEHTEGESVCL